ncbi:papain-like cysteine protease family protein [Pelagibius marinus]|uniref:papain-like cysteine protease family protein n=1 Tax=Pelagibius marinus TaxID=2762760 RepID=UPI001872ED90|nr:papain-like cysteine protease family protein [Pelagibius marinus]
MFNSPRRHHFFPEILESPATASAAKWQRPVARWDNGIYSRVQVTIINQNRIRAQVMLSLPYVNQVGETHCGAACLEMIYSHFDVARTQGQIWDDRKKPRTNGYDELVIPTVSVALDAQEQGLQAIAFGARDLIASLKQCDEAAIPAVIPGSLKPSKNFRNLGHFRLFLGFEPPRFNKVRLHDPLHGENKLLTIAMLRSLTSTKDGGEIFGNWLVAVSNTDKAPHSCATCGSQIAETIACENCGYILTLDLPQLLGCMSADCTGRMWVGIGCPSCFGPMPGSQI